MSLRKTVNWSVVVRDELCVSFSHDDLKATPHCSFFVPSRSQNGRKKEEYNKSGAGLSEIGSFISVIWIKPRVKFCLKVATIMKTRLAYVCNRAIKEILRAAICLFATISGLFLAMTATLAIMKKHSLSMRFSSWEQSGKSFGKWRKTKCVHMYCETETGPLLFPLAW